jgi:hypothetical protein
MMEGTCDVSLGDYDGDEAEFFDSRLVKARKAHSCYECDGEIAVGAQYERVSGKWDGELRTYHFCLPCAEIATEFSESRTFGFLWEGMEQNWHEGAHITACMNRLTTADAKRRLHDQWLKWKDLK